MSIKTWKTINTFREDGSLEDARQYYISGPNPGKSKSMSWYIEAQYIEKTSKINPELKQNTILPTAPKVLLRFVETQF